MKKVAVIMGSASDLPIAEKAIEQLESLNVPYEVHVFSAHRTPSEAMGFASKADDNGIAAIIAVAGKAAHLAGVLASHTTIPVIGIPAQGSDLGGMDALLSTVQMPPGIPVATMAINGGKNAAIFAAQILSLSEPGLKEKLKTLRSDMTKNVLESNRAIEEKYNK